MESTQDQKPINHNSSDDHDKQEDDNNNNNKDPSVSDKNHHQRLHSSSSSSSSCNSRDESNRLVDDKDAESNRSAKKSTGDETKNNPKSKPYKIPSFVFARTNTTAPTEWSTASNESLFSIQMGNVSFSRDHLKSGELGLPSWDSTFSGPLIDVNSDLQPSSGPTPSSSGSNNTESSCTSDHRVTKEEGKADQNVREITGEKEETKSTTGKEAIRSISYRSDGGSVKSFAFPILGDADKNGLCVSPRLKHRKGSQKQQQELMQKQPETPKMSDAAKREELKEKAIESPKMQTPKKTNSSRSSNSSNSSKWLSCFTCCATSCG